MPHVSGQHAIFVGVWIVKTNLQSLDSKQFNALHMTILKYPVGFQKIWFDFCNFGVKIFFELIMEITVNLHKKRG